MLTDQELQSLRNLGNQCEEAASEICSLRAALTQKRAEYEDLKQTMHNMAQNHALQLEAARKHEPESVPELRAQLQTLGLWIAGAADAGHGGARVQHRGRTTDGADPQGRNACAGFAGAWRGFGA